MRSHRTAELVISGLGLLALVVLGFVLPSARAGGFQVDGTAVLLSIIVPAILLVFLGIWGKRSEKKG
ncbi:hypothetical protein [Saccharothrix sp. HUAS TT1]|uniref:hypothetical protein n=1 Tax=unclassified Saccharothrix TaxID=2593673 RepID=UPI00345B6F03